MGDWSTAGPGRRLFGSWVTQIPERNGIGNKGFEKVVVVHMDGAGCLARTKPSRAGRPAGGQTCVLGCPAGLALVHQMSSRANDRRLETDLHRLHPQPTPSASMLLAAGFHCWGLPACLHLSGADLAALATLAPLPSLNPPACPPPSTHPPLGRNRMTVQASPIASLRLSTDSEPVMPDRP